MPPPFLAGFNKRKEVRYGTSFPGANLSDFPKLFLISDSDIAAELASGGGIAFTTDDGVTEIPLGLYSTADLSSGDVPIRVLLDVLTGAATGDLYGYIYYDASETTVEDKTGVVANNYIIFTEWVNDGGTLEVLDWVSESSIGTFAGGLSVSDLVSGEVSQALNFDGSDDYADLGDISALDGAGVLTFGGIGRRQATGNYLGFGKSTSGSERFGILFFSDGNCYVSVSNGGSAFGGFASNDTSRHSVAAVFDGSQVGNARMLGYLDGVIQSPSYSGTFPNTTHGGSASFEIGRIMDGGGNNRYADGDWEEVWIANVVRSADWLEYVHTDDFDNADTFTLGPEETAGGGGGATGVCEAVGSEAWATRSTATGTAMAVPLSIPWADSFGAAGSAFIGTSATAVAQSPWSDAAAVTTTATGAALAIPFLFGAEAVAARAVGSGSAVATAPTAYADSWGAAGSASAASVATAVCPTPWLDAVGSTATATGTALAVSQVPYAEARAATAIVVGTAVASVYAIPYSEAFGAAGTATEATGSGIVCGPARVRNLVSGPASVRNLVSGPATVREC